MSNPPKKIRFKSSINKAKSAYADVSFEELSDMIYTAETVAKKGWDINFIDDMVDKLEKYGEDTLVTENQYDHICRIAEG